MPGRRRKRSGRTPRRGECVQYCAIGEGTDTQGVKWDAKSLKINLDRPCRVNRVSIKVVARNGNTAIVPTVYTQVGASQVPVFNPTVGRAMLACTIPATQTIVPRPRAPFVQLLPDEPVLVVTTVNTVGETKWTALIHIWIEYAHQQKVVYAGEPSTFSNPKGNPEDDESSNDLSLSTLGLN